MPEMRRVIAVHIKRKFQDTILGELGGLDIDGLPPSTTATSERPRPPTGVTERCPSRVSVRSRKSSRCRPRDATTGSGNA
jgi:hypothetical protein